MFGNRENLKAELAQHRHVDVAAGAVEVGENDLGRRAVEQRRFQQQSLEARDIQRVHFRAEDGDLAARSLGQDFVKLAADRVHLPNDAFCIGVNDLGTVVEIRFEAVVVRRIVAGGQDHTRVGAEFAHRKGKLRRRACPFKKIRITAEIGTDLGTELREIAREMAGVVRKHQDRLAARSRALFGISNQPTHRTAEVVEIHCRRADAGMFGATIRPADSLFHLRHHAADRAAAQTARAKRQRLEKAIVEFFPSLSVDQFLHCPQRNITRRSAKQGRDVRFCRFEQAAIGNCGGKDFGERAHFDPHHSENRRSGNPVR